MNYKIISAVLGTVAAIVGACMFLCLPWGSAYLGGGSNELQGARGLLFSGGISMALAGALAFFGRGADKERLFRKEAIVIVALSWIMAVFLGALPYLFAGVLRATDTPMSFCDAFFESASGLTTTGATVFSSLENKETLPRTILMWRMTTHFLGGLGVICFFVALLGHGANGKAVFKIERSVSSAPAAKMRTTASYLFFIYISLNIVCCVALLCCGTSLFDAISHAFSVVALGGFSTRDASVAYFTADPNANGLAVEIVLCFFMIASGTNYWLIYWCAVGKPGKLFRDSEWRLFMSLLIVGIAATTFFGVVHRDFKKTLPEETDVAVEVGGQLDRYIIDDGSDDPENLNRRPNKTIAASAPRAGLWESFRRASFQTISLATGAGFATYRYEYWNSTSLIILAILMYIGGCAGSAAGGAKVIRALLAWKSISQSLAATFSPNVVRSTRIDGEIVDKERLHAAVAYLFAFSSLIFVTAAIVTALEPDAIWLARHESQVEKMSDIYVASISMYANVGPAFGVLGSFDNFGALSDPTKFLFGWAALLGRLEIWTILALFSPNFWRNR